jgi:hypothetical protein
VVLGVLGAAAWERRGQLAGLPEDWWRKRREPKERLCYRTKSEALQAFRDANRHQIEDWGGLDTIASPAEFDAINARYGLKGSRAVRTLAQALWAVMPAHAPFCLDEIDVETLNETSPGQHGTGFVLPSWAYDLIAARDEAEHYATAG